MTDGKKKRMSMLDSLAAAGAVVPAPSITGSRPLRAAREAVDGVRLWELDPDQIVDDRVSDRLVRDDIEDLRDSIETSGQTVPILVRRHPTEADKYLLVYGRRRVEAIRTSDKVTKVRALIAELDERGAVEAQVAENLARRDLTFIEKALFAHELIETGFGSQVQVAEVLTVTKSSVSMALAVVGAVGPAAVRAIGPAPGIGRPRWEELARAVEASGRSEAELLSLIDTARAEVAVDILDHETGAEPSVRIFEKVLAELTRARTAPPRRSARTPARRALRVGDGRGSVTRTRSGLRLELGSGPFSDWVEAQAQDLVDELHQRWKERGED